MNEMAMNEANCAGAPRQAGFTLLELMIAVAIVAILAAIAIPSYTSYMVKTNRAAAEGCLSEYSNYMERYYTTSLRYDEGPASSGTAIVANPIIASPASVVDCAAPSQTGSNYKYTAPAVSATSYTVQAAPTGAQLTRDTQCGTLTLNQAGTRTISSTATGTVAQCWGG